MGNVPIGKQPDQWIVLIHVFVSLFSFSLIVFACIPVYYTRSFHIGIRTSFFNSYYLGHSELLSSHMHEAASNSLFFSSSKVVKFDVVEFISCISLATKTNANLTFAMHLIFSKISISMLIFDSASVNIWVAMSIWSLPVYRWCNESWNNLIICAIKRFNFLIDSITFLLKPRNAPLSYNKPSHRPITKFFF